MAARCAPYMRPTPFGLEQPRHLKHYRVPTRTKKKQHPVVSLQACELIERAKRDEVQRQHHGGGAHAHAGGEARAAEAVGSSVCSIRK